MHMWHVLHTSGIVDAVGGFFSAEPQKCILVGGVRPKDIELDSCPPLYTGPGHKAVLSILYFHVFFFASVWSPSRGLVRQWGHFKAQWRPRARCGVGAGARLAAPSFLCRERQPQPCSCQLCKGPLQCLWPPHIPKWPLQREFADWWHQFYENSCNGMIL